MMNAWWTLGDKAVIIIQSYYSGSRNTKKCTEKIIPGVGPLDGLSIDPSNLSGVCYGNDTDD